MGPYITFVFACDGLSVKVFTKVGTCLPIEKIIQKKIVRKIQKKSQKYASKVKKDIKKDM